MTNKLLEELAENGHLVKVFWKDTSGEDRVKKGRIVEVGKDFVKFSTRYNSYFVSREAISSIKVLEVEK